METPHTVMAGVASVNFKSWIQSSTARMPNPLSTITMSGALMATICVAASRLFSDARNSRSPAEASRLLSPSAVIGWVSHTTTDFFE